MCDIIPMLQAVIFIISALYCHFRFQMMKKCLESCQLLHCLPQVARKTISKRELSAFILNFVFLQNNNVVLRVKKANSHTNVSHVCVPRMIFPTLKGTDMSLQSLSCVCLLGDDYSSLTCYMSHSFSIHL